jgi:hypothetical protein
MVQRRTAIYVTTIRRARITFLPSLLLRVRALTRIGVTPPNLWVLVLFAPGSRRKIRLRIAARRPWKIAAGALLCIRGERLRVVATTPATVCHPHCIEQRLEVATEHAPRERRRITARAVASSPALPHLAPAAIVPDGSAPVIEMPVGEISIVANFLRYQQLVRVYEGDPDLWLAHLQRGIHGDDPCGDLRFVRWIRTRLRSDPMLIHVIRLMVEETALWELRA